MKGRLALLLALAMPPAAAPHQTAAQVPPGGEEALLALKRQTGEFRGIIQRYKRELPARKMKFAQANFDFTRRAAPMAERILAGLRSVLGRYPGNPETRLAFMRESHDVLSSLGIALSDAENLFRVASDLPGSAHADVLRLQAAITTYRVDEATHFAGGEAALLARMRAAPNGLTAYSMASAVYSNVEQKDWPAAVRMLAQQRREAHAANYRAAERRQQQAAADAQMAEYRRVPAVYEPLWTENKLRNPKALFLVIDRQFEAAGQANRFRRVNFVNLLDNGGMIDLADYLSANVRSLYLLCRHQVNIPLFNDKYHFFFRDGRLTNYSEDHAIIDAALADARAVVDTAGCRGALDWAASMRLYRDWARQKVTGQ